MLSQEMLIKLNGPCTKGSREEGLLRRGETGMGVGKWRVEKTKTHYTNVKNH